jgi:hypothetical protein
MGTRDEVAIILDSSPLAGRLNPSDADTLSVDMREIGGYLSMLVEELRILHQAVLVLGTRLDQLSEGSSKP